MGKGKKQYHSPKSNLKSNEESISNHWLEKLNMQQRKFVLCLSALDQPFTAKYVAKIIHIPLRGVKIRLGKLERSGQLIKQSKPGKYSFRSQVLKTKIYNYFSDSERNNIHHRIYNVLNEYREKSNLKDGYHLAIQGCLSHQPNTTDLLKTAIKNNILLGRNHRVITLFRYCNRYGEKKRMEYHYWFFLGEYLLARGKIDKANKAFRFAFQNSLKTKENENRAAAIIRLGYCQSLFNPNFSFIRFVINLFKQKGDVHFKNCLRVLSDFGNKNLIPGFLDTVYCDAKYSHKFTKLIPKVENLKRSFWKRFSENDLDTAELALVEMLECNRSCFCRDQICSGLLQLSTWHLFRGNNKKSRSVLEMVENQYRYGDRPEIENRILWSKLLLFIDQGKLIEAETEIIKCERNTQINRERAIILQFWRIVIWLRQKKVSDAFYGIKKLAEIPYHLPLFISRYLIYSSLSLESIDKKVRLEIARKLLSKNRFCIGENILNDVDDYLINCASFPSAFRSKKENFNINIWNKSYMVNDFLGMFQFALSRFDQKIKEREFETINIDKLVEISGFPGFREFQIDLILSSAEIIKYPSASIDKNKTIRLLNRAKNIALKLGDKRRLERINNRIGANYQAISDLDIPNKILKLTINYLQSIAKVNDIDLLEEILIDTLMQLTASNKVQLFTIHDQVIRLQNTENYHVSFQRKLFKVISEFIRSEKNSDFKGSFMLLRWSTLNNHRAAVFWEVDSNLNNKMSMDLLDVILNYAQDRINGIANNHMMRNKLEIVGIQSSDTNGLIGISQEIQNVRDLIHRVSKTDSNVHITGETGVGKEVVAKAIHESGPRKHKPFQAYNCAIAPKDIIESELFGHLRGAFTGAQSNRKGIFASANGGTIFLDEVADLPPATQTKILRFLEEKEVRPLGSDKSIKIDVRIISATNKNLEKEMKKMRFRKDLYFRLMVMEIDIPPLRNRSEDVELLLNYFLKHYCKKMDRPFTHFEPSVLNILKQYSWPGNIRELQNIVEVGLNLSAPGEMIKFKHIKHKIKNQKSSETQSLQSFISEKEKQYVEKIIRINGYNITQSAKKLGISRQGLFKKVRKYSIIIPDRHRVHVGEEL